MHTNSSKPKILGMYLSENRDLYNNTTRENSYFTDEGFKYLPVLELFSISSNEDVRFIDGKNINNEIVTYNRNVSTQKLSNDIVERKRIDITQNDILLGPIHIILNLTEHNITMSLQDEYRKTFRPIRNKHLESYYGKVLILTIQSFNNPKVIQNLEGYTNYLENLINKFKTKGNYKHEEMISILTYLNDKWSYIKTKNILEDMNSLKVVSLVEIDSVEFTSVSNKTLFIPSRNFYLSCESLVNIPDHPGSNAVFNTGDMKGYLKENSFVCYIVDNNDQISDRYINIAGNVRSIMKIKNHNLVNGLYIISTNNHGNSTNEIVCKLEDIDSNQFVFRSIEEANEGADIRTQYKDSLEKAKAELEAYRIEKANENLQIKNDYEKKNLELKNEYERKIKDQTLSFEKYIHDLKKDLEESKFKHETTTLQEKSKYESKRFERDTIVETIKTIGAIAGFAAGGYVLYNKIKTK